MLRAGGRGGGDGGETWTGGLDPGLSFFVWPTVVDYTIDYANPFSGQYGPIPFQDPWWKLLLIIIAIILSIAAAVWAAPIWSTRVMMQSSGH